MRTHHHPNRKEPTNGQVARTRRPRRVAGGDDPHTVMEIAGEKDWSKERLLLLILVYLERTMVDGDAIHNLLDHLEDQE